MKKLIYIVLATFMLISCAPQKQLARFLARHPELAAVDTVYIHDTIIIPKETASKPMSLEDIIKLDSAATAQKATNDSLTATDKPKVGVENSKSDAALIAHGNGLFELQVNTKPDTIYINKPYPVPCYITKTEYKDKMVHEMRWWEKTFFTIGIVVTLIIIIIGAVKIGMKFAKPI